MNERTGFMGYLEQPFPAYFLVGLILLNSLAISQFDPLYIGSLFAFIYIVVTPGFLLLPFLTEKKMPPMLGVVFSVVLSLFALMVSGLALNTVLPYFGMAHPLSTMPLLITYDVLVYVLLVFNYAYRKSSPFEFHEFNALNWTVTGVALLLPIFACVGAIILNNGGSNVLAMALLAIAAFLALVLVLEHERLNASIPPLVLYLTGLSFLLTNSMRGWYITGHDILLEYHVFTLTNSAHLWNMAFYQDPYMACLSLTILPTYLVSLLQVSPAYIFKFFTQFLGALSVIPVYYLVKRYTSEKTAFVSGFLFITFPTFLVDLAFLNRQDIAFVFFGCLLFILFTAEYVNGWRRTVLLFLLGTGVVLSHYSSSYVMIALFMAAYAINYALRFLVNAKRPRFLVRFTQTLGNREMYRQPILLKLPFVLGMLLIMLVWSTFITKTSTSFFNTIQQIVTTMEHPFSLDQFSGPAQYNLFQSKQMTPAQLLQQFEQQSEQSAGVAVHQSNFYPPSITDAYPLVPVLEPIAPLTSFGTTTQSVLHLNLTSTYNFIKQFYAKLVQVLLLLGVLGLAFGYGFRKQLLHDVPIEYTALSIAGILLMVGQTILPADAIDYGLLRLFQQNLTFLALPITLTLIWLCTFVARSQRAILAVCMSVLIFFFVILSGFFPQFTGGARPPLPLNNNGLYYDSYYVHAQEVYSANWLALNATPLLPIQAAHFSDIKLIAYGHIGVYISLLPQTINRLSYVYLNYDNVESDNILEIVNGNVVYYKFPMAFLQNNKNLIYNNGGSEIYR